MAEQGKKAVTSDELVAALKKKTGRDYVVVPNGEGSLFKLVLLQKTEITNWVSGPALVNYVRGMIEGR
jgi:hypothetical protein